MRIQDRPKLRACDITRHVLYWCADKKAWITLCSYDQCGITDESNIRQRGNAMVNYYDENGPI